MSRPTTPTRESGFALILALLALVLLTTMGLALSNSTSVELQISSNHRWSESARFNAEAGIEYGKSLLMSQASWTPLLPPVRTVSDWAPTTWDGSATAPTGTATLNRATRNFENWKCDGKGFGMGYGVVFDTGGPAPPGETGAEEYKSQIAGASLNGAFTLWVRRPVRWNGLNGTGSQLEDYPGSPDTTSLAVPQPLIDDVLILVSEGVAPFAGAANAGAFAATNKAVYTIETLLSRQGTTILDQSACTTRQGQAGGSSSGGNTSGCVSLKTPQQITEALGGAGGGTGALK